MKLTKRRIDFSGNKQEDLKLDEIKNSIFKKHHEDQDTINCVERMYRNGKEKQRKRSKPREINNKHIQKISKSPMAKRDDSVTDYLYLDAVRRRKEFINKDLSSRHHKSNSSLMLNKSMQSTHRNK